MTEIRPSTVRHGMLPRLRASFVSTRIFGLIVKKKHAPQLGAFVYLGTMWKWNARLFLKDKTVCVSRFLGHKF